MRAEAQPEERQTSEDGAYSQYAIQRRSGFASEAGPLLKRSNPVRTLPREVRTPVADVFSTSRAKSGSRGQTAAAQRLKAIARMMGACKRGA